MAQSEYVGIDVAVDVNGSPYRVQEVRARIHGEMGDLTSGEDFSKRRKLTVPDAEVTLTKASFDPDQNPFSSPFDMTLGADVAVIIYPGGRNGDLEPFFFDGLVIDESDYSVNANALQPVTCHLVQGSGNDPSSWYPN